MQLRPGTFHWEICDRCRGNGQIDHPAFSNGITSDEWAEWGDEDRENYLSGMYDIPCPDCTAGKVKVPIIARLTFSEKRDLVHEMRRRQWAAESLRERMIEDRMLGEY